MKTLWLLAFLLILPVVALADAEICFTWSPYVDASADKLVIYQDSFNTPVIDNIDPTTVSACFISPEDGIVHNYWMIAWTNDQRSSERTPVIAWRSQLPDPPPPPTNWGPTVIDGFTLIVVPIGS